MEKLFLFIIPLILVIAMTKMNLISLPKQLSLYLIIVFTFAFIGRFIGFMIIGTKNLIFSENGISFVNAVIYYILRFLLSCLTFTVNFFTCLFLIKKSTSKPFYEETKQYSKVSKFDFTFKNPFKRRSTDSEY